MFDIDVKDVKRLENELKGFKIRALPFATKATLNKAAFETQTVARQTIKEDMVNRNSFTVRSIQVDQARTLNIKAQSSIVGSTADYMETQEFGGVTDHLGKHDTVIPTSWAAGQGMKAKPRTRLPRKANNLRNIKLGDKIRRGRSTGNMSRRQAAFLRGLLAARQGNKFVFIPGGTDASSGIYRVWGRNKVKGQYRGIKLRMAYRLKDEGSAIPRNPWLKPAVDVVAPQMQRFYGEALAFQLKRHGLFRG